MDTTSPKIAALFILKDRGIIKKPSDAEYVGAYNDAYIFAVRGHGLCAVDASIGYVRSITFNSLIGE